MKYGYMEKEEEECRIDFSVIRIYVRVPLYFLLLYNNMSFGCSHKGICYK